MSLITIESDLLIVQIHPKGAELQSVHHRKQQVEYLWQGDPKFWGKRSPVLFPIVGTLRDNRYQYSGRGYEMGRHGFARDMDFSVLESSGSKAVFMLEDSEATRKKYPFAFRLEIAYTVSGATLSVSYRVINPSASEVCWFSIGGHPAFRVPLDNSTAYDDYYLEFEHEETADRWPISKDGLIEAEPRPLLQQTKRLPLHKDLFARDAIVLKHLRSGWVRLATDKTSLGFRFDFAGFPYLGIWAAPGADFVCIEPWCGIADSVSASGNLIDKEGIIRLEPGGEWVREWKVVSSK